MAEANFGFEGIKDNGSKGIELRTNDTIFYKMNKSCDSCNVAKRKCDHKLPCSRCIGKGHGHLCTYRTRKPCKTYRTAKRLGAAAGTNPEPLHSKTRIVRARFSPSPATGLVGVKENAFLNDFFGGVGFLPLTSERHIRKIIVKMMMKVSEPSPSPGCNHPEGDGCSLGNGTACSCLEWGFNGMVTGPSACIIWSAVALGALAKGAPSEEVNDYLHIARAEINASFPLNAEAVGAWTIYGYLHGFLGDMEEFSRCLKRAGALMSACKENGCKESFPIGLAEIIKWDKSPTVRAMSREDMQALSDEKITPPEMSSYISQAEAYRYIMALNRAIVQVCARLSLSAEEAAQRDGDRNEAFDTTELLQNKRTAPNRDGRVKLIPITLDVLKDKLKDNAFDFDMLEKSVTNRSRVSNGLGGAMINMLLSAAAAGDCDRQGLFEKTKQVVAVFERYPGLFRFRYWLYAPHYLVCVLGAVGDPEARSMYDRVRTANNLMRNPSTPEIPPFEERLGFSSICDYPVCSIFRDRFERLLSPAPCELNQSAFQVDSYAEGATVAECSDCTGKPAPDRRTPGQGIRLASQEEDDGIEDTDVLSVEGDVEIGMLSTLANTDPAALEESFFPQGHLPNSAKQAPSTCSRGAGTSADGGFKQMDLTDIDGKMAHEVSSLEGCDRSHDAGAAAEIVIDAADWAEAIAAIHSSPELCDWSTCTPTFPNAEQT